MAYGESFFRIVSSDIWKNEPRKKAQLEPWKLQIFTFWIVTPSLRAHKSNALIVITTARNSGTVPVSPSVSQHFSIAFVCLQGHSRKQRLRWLIYHSGSKSRNSSLTAVVLSSVVRERSRVATYRACYRHCRASVRDLGHEIFCAYVVAESYSKQPRVQDRSWLRRCYQSH